MYSLWNRAIGQHFFNRERSGKTVVLTVDTDTLLEIAQEAELPLTNLDEIDIQFSAAVQEEVSESGWEVGPLERDRYPRCLAKVALLVLVAFRMAATQEASARAYWLRFSELFKGRKPDRVDLESLWRKGLERWANRIQQGEWGRVDLPADRQTSFRWVRLAKSQVLLRLADLRSLPQFFSETGLRPGASRSEIEGVISHQSYKLRQHVCSVLGDQTRRPRALEQIEQSLAEWDGTTYQIPLSRAHAHLRCWIRWVDTEIPQLEGGLLHASETGGELVSGVTLSEILAASDRQLVAEGFSYQSFRRDALLAVWDPWTEGFLEVRVAYPREEVLILVATAEERSWRDLRCVASSGQLEVFRPQDLTGLPVGWIAVRFVVAPALNDDLGPWAELILRRRRFWAEGGLRRSRNVWMAGAGPRIVFEDPIPDEAQVDGDSHPVTDGRLTPENVPQLDEEGTHEIRVEGARPLEVRVASPRLTSSISSGSVAWRAELPKWPSGGDPVLATTSSRSPSVDGVWLEGAWKSEESRAGSGLERQWLEAALAFRGFSRFSRSTVSGHQPLLRLLNAAALHRRGAKGGVWITTISE